MFPPLPAQLPPPPRGMLHPGTMRMQARPYRPHGLYGAYAYPSRVGYGYAPQSFPLRGAPPLPAPRSAFTPKQVLARPASGLACQTSEKGAAQSVVDAKAEKKPCREVHDLKKEGKEKHHGVGAREAQGSSKVNKAVANDAWSRYLGQSVTAKKSETSEACIWSVSPEDLVEMMKHELGGDRKLSPHAQQHIKSDSSSTNSRNEDASTRKKYFCLPFLHEFRCDGSWGGRGSLQRAVKDSNSSAQAQPNVPGVLLDYRKLFGPGQDTTPFTAQCFQPQRYYDDVIPTYGDSEQIPPHMSWRPGDWKCAKCGNHNFSYRGLCKRCREGRFEDAGFVFPIRF